MIRYIEDDPAFLGPGEASMTPALVRWLESARWLRSDSLVFRELPVHGRRVDLVTLTRSGVMSAYELKLGSFGRVLEQAAYNCRIFDRSWVVVGEQPREKNLEEATRFGVGVIAVVDGRPRILVRPAGPQAEPVSRARVLTRLKKMGAV